MRPIRSKLLGALTVAVGLIGGFAVTSSAEEAKIPAGVGHICGTIARIQCATDLWCDEEAGKCGGTDLQGVCVMVPELCPKEYRPVCGCEGKTYHNDCERRMAKEAKDHDGACKKK